MATVEETRTRTLTAPLVLHDVPWALYEDLRDIEANNHVRMTYDHGRLEIMSPQSARHENYAELIGRMIQAVAEELDIPIRSLRSTTWKRAPMAGLEADCCYFIRNAARVIGREANDLQQDETPDLAVEVEITNSAEAKLPIYAALGIPELWRYDGSELRSWQLGADGQYAPAEHSLNLPFLRPADLEPFLEAIHDDETRWIKGFRQWVRKTFAAEN